MSHPLLDYDFIDQEPEPYLRSVGVVFTRFDTQDSGNISYGVQVGEERFFVKTAGHPDDPQPFLDHPDRVALLRNAARLSARFRHPSLPCLYRVIESPSGPLLVYAWAEGELLGTPRARRDDPESAFQRFRSLPVPVILRCLDTIYELHNEMAHAGWIASDFYDGCLIYDFGAERLWIMDLDNYRDAPFRNKMGRMFGSTRFMAPEEFERGALIDEQTTVFTMGRTALVFLSNGTLDADAFRGPRAIFEVAIRACQPERSRRFDSMAAFHRAWQDARTADLPS